MEYLFLLLIALVVILISAFVSANKELEKKNIKPTKEEKKYDIDAFLAKARELDKEREEAGRTCQSIDFRITGTQYRSDEAIERANGLELFELLYLEWEKDNPQDPYAIKVLTDDGYHIGYMPAKYTKKFHSKINEYTECKVWDIKDQDYTDAPLIEVHAFFEWKKRIRKSSIKNNLEKGLE